MSSFFWCCLSFILVLFFSFIIFWEKEQWGGEFLCTERTCIIIRCNRDQAFDINLCYLSIFQLEKSPAPFASKLAGIYKHNSLTFFLQISISGKREFCSECGSPSSSCAYFMVCDGLSFYFIKILD